MKACFFEENAGIGVMMSDKFLPVGAFYENDLTTFCVWAPQRQRVDLVANDRLSPMIKNERGYWSAALRNVRPGDTYLFKIDSEKLLPDPASLSQPFGVHGKSVVAERSFQWTDQQWKGLPLSDMIIYELHVGTFT